MATAAGLPIEAEESVELDVYPPEQRSRWTVLLRLLLAVPQLIVLWLLSVAAFIVLVCGWFGALAMGRLPDWCGNYLRGYFGYAARVHGYTMLLVDAYPPFAWNPPDYPIRIEIPAPTPLNRVAVFFRIILAFPILVLTSWLSAGWAILAVIVWLIVLFTGRMPQAVFEATAAVLRAELRTQTYLYLLTPTYLKGIFGDKAANGHALQPDSAPQSPTRPLLLSSRGRALLILMLVLGILASLFRAATSTDDEDDYDADALPATQLADEVSVDFIDRTGHTPQSVHCPSGLSAMVGASELCTVHDAGREYPAYVTVDAITDGAAHFKVIIQHLN